MTVYCFSIQGTVRAAGEKRKVEINTIYNTSNLNASLALDDFLSQNDQYDFSGRQLEMKMFIDEARWVRYSEGWRNGCILTVEFIAQKNQSYVVGK